MDCRAEDPHLVETVAHLHTDAAVVVRVVEGVCESISVLISSAEATKRPYEDLPFSTAATDCRTVWQEFGEDCYPDGEWTRLNVERIREDWQSPD
ncbi:MAG: hypothetical protein AAGA56_24900 [Myxococcota bacterium]